MTIRFIEKNLAQGEQLLYRTQPHWIVFGRPFFLTLGLLLFAYVFPHTATLAYLILPILLIFWVIKLIEYTCTEFGVTDKRVVVKMGLIQVEIVDTLLQRIESVQVSQSLLGRMLGYGTVTICGTGGDRYPFQWIKDPLVFRSHIQERQSSL